MADKAWFSILTALLYPGGTFQKSQDPGHAPEQVNENIGGGSPGMGIVKAPPVMSTCRQTETTTKLHLDQNQETVPYAGNALFHVLVPRLHNL